MGPIRSRGHSREVERRTLSVGLIADPDLPAEIAEDLADQPPELLTDQVDPEIRWEVSVRRQRLPVHQHPKALIKAARDWLETERWDLAIASPISRCRSTAARWSRRRARISASV
jgi:hypothetical protein